MSLPRVYFAGTMWPFWAFAQPILEGKVEIVVEPEKVYSAAELGPILAGCDGALLTAFEKVPREVIQASQPRLRVLAKYGVGIETIDLDAATEAGVLVANTPGANSLGVAEHTIALMMSLLRNVPQLDRLVRTGNWNEARRYIGGDIEGSTIGMVGFGNVGQLVGKRAAALGMRVLAYDPYLSAERAAAAGATRVDDLDAMLGEADVVSLHMVVTPETTRMFDAGRFAKFKRGARLINTARAQLVDQDAMIAALKSGQLGGAAVDVSEPEPLGAESPLYELDNLIITPHHAGTTIRTRERTLTQAAENLVIMLRGEVPAVGVCNPAAKDAFLARSKGPLA
jgi:D-3-phosphoglycerate dehydrogenase